MAYLMEDSDEEGIFDEFSDITEQEPPSPYLQMKKSPKKEIPNDKRVDYYLDIIKKQEDKLTKIQNELKEKQDVVNLLTTGYLKDIQHLKEMVFRKEFNLGIFLINFYVKKDNHDFFDVEFLDTNLILDENVRKIVNDKISNLKKMYNKKAQELYKKILSLSDTIESLRKKYEEGQSTQSEEKLYDSVREVLKLNSNPYQIWKAFSVLKDDK